jgi:hypothetical protein
MKTLQIFGKDLPLKIEIAYISPINKPAHSFAIDIELEEKRGKLIIHSREVLKKEAEDEYISTFTATLLTGELFPCLCTGIYCQKGEIEETWITIIDEKFM